MHQATLEVMESFDGGPLPPVHKARSVHQDVTPVSDDLTIVLNLDLPLPLILMPMC